MHFRLTLLLSVIVLTGCAAEELPAAEEAAAEPEVIAVREAPPVVGTWTWAASDTRIGNIDLGKEQFVFRDDGTYAVVSKAADGSSDCYEGTFTWSTREPGHGTIVFKNSRIRNPEESGFGRDVYLRGDDTLDFEEGGTYRRTGPVLDIRCP